MQSLIEKVKSLGLRIDLATTAPRQLENEDFLVFSKLEALGLDQEGKLVPKLKIAVGGLGIDPKNATAVSLANLEKIFDTETLKLILSKGFGYDVAVTEPFYQKSEEYLVVGKVETFDFDNQGKPRTMTKVSVNLFNENPVQAQEEAIKAAIDATKKLQ